MQPHDARRPADSLGVVGRVFGAQLGGECGKPLLRVRDAHATLQPGQATSQRVAAPRPIERHERRRAKTSWRPHFDARTKRSSRMIEAGGHDANHFVPVAVDAQLPPDGIGAAAEAALPQAVAEHDHLGDPRGRVFVGAEHPTELRLHTEQREI